MVKIGENYYFTDIIICRKNQNNVEDILGFDDNGNGNFIWYGYSLEGIMKELFDKLLNELDDADGYIGFDKNEIETDDNCLIITDFLLANFKDHSTKLAYNDSDAYETIGLCFKYNNYIIEVTDSIQDNNVDYREIYILEDKGNIDTEPIDFDFLFEKGVF